MRSLRAYLLALVVGAVVPLVVLTATHVMGSAARERQAIDAGLISTSRALATSVEHELLRSIAALQVLAASPRLASGDIAGFYSEAREAMAQLPWFTVWLAAADGRQVMNLLVPLGAPLPTVADRPYFIEALRSGKPAVSDLIIGRVSKQPNITVAVPRMKNGRVAFVIAAALQPATFNGILASAGEGLETATASVIGRDFVVIARNRDAQRWTGQRANENYISSLTDATEGVIRTATLEGDAVYAAYRRLPDSGWTVGLGVRAAEVEGPSRRALGTSAVLGLAGLLFAGTVAALLSWRISVPIRRLAAVADGIALGRHDAPPLRSNIVEIETLAKALQFAARATLERDELAEQARRITAELEGVEIRERQQIARDLHDDLSQTLSAAQIRLAALRMHADPEVVRSATAISELVGRANESTRSLAEQLSPPVLYELGLVPALEWLAHQLTKDYGLNVEIRDDGRLKPLSMEAASILFRCVRELLINVSKHAGTETACVTLAIENEQDLVVHVLDGGRGIDPSAAFRGIGQARLGLRAVRERLAYLGGVFKIAAVPGGGCDASMRLPLRPPVTGDCGSGAQPLSAFASDASRPTP